MAEPIKEVRPPIIKRYYYGGGNYKQDTGRLFKNFIGDFERLSAMIDQGSVTVIDEDILRINAHLKLVAEELTMMIVYKFPDQIDISKEDLLKHYGIKS